MDNHTVSAAGRFEQVHEQFTIPTSKRLIIVRGGPSQERDEAARRIAELIHGAAATRFVRDCVYRLENYFCSDAGNYQFYPERLHDAIAGVRAGISWALQCGELPVVTAGTFMRRKHMMEYVYDGHIAKHELLVLEVVTDQYTPNESRRTPAEIAAQVVQREHFLHAFKVTADCQFTVQGSVGGVE